jgi:ubiquinone/menaquinone biosynthesis C-methylase UbiE
MPRNRDELIQTERLSRRYRLHQSKIMLEIERRVCGCDYGATSWATRDEVEAIAGLLELGPERRLLDLGAGSGWPALYWARTVGCKTVLVDVPFSALRIATERAAVSGLSTGCWTVAAEGASLPFKSSSFDCVSHSDVLCCLEAKLTTLQECRRVIRLGGQMVFTVISIAPNLGIADREIAVQYGPPFVASTIDYPALLSMSGWTITHHRDFTAEYEAAVRRLLCEEEAHAVELSKLFGPAEYSETLVRRRMTAEIIHKRFLRRELFAAMAEPIPNSSL